MLGPLDVRGVGERTVRAAKHRGLLAILLINANRVVPLGTLIDELWDDAPLTASNLVRQYISQLRKVLSAGDTGGVELRTHNAGYALLVPPSATDVEEFEQLVSQARERLCGGRPDQARHIVSQALRLWRGQAFADVACGPRIFAEQARLEEVRVSAQELCAEAGFAAGQFAEAISELRALTVQYPLRERLHAKLMQALSASGRKADALAAYRTARENLVAELGLEPSQELREAEQSILAEDAAPELRPAPPPPVVMTPLEPSRPREEVHLVPAQLPPALSDFVGRRAEMVEVRRLLSPGGRSIGWTEPGTSPEFGDAGACPPVVVLCGLGGVGKTVLAVQLGHLLQRDFPDGQLFVRLRDGAGRALDPAEALRYAIEVLGCPLSSQPAGLLAQQHLYRSLLAERRALLILDDAVDEPQVRQLLPGRGGSAVLVTSRSRLAALDGAQQVVVPAFTTKEAVQLLASVVGPDRVMGEQEVAGAIGAACEGLPLAIRVAAAMLRQLPHRRLRHLLERLDGDRIFDELVVGDLNVGEVVADTYTELGRDEQDLLCRIGADGSLGPSPVVSEQDLDAPTQSVDRLVEVGALEVVGQDRDGGTLFRCVGLLGRYACRHAEPLGLPALIGLRRQRQRADPMGSTASA
jgi:DNA-binding SARP family transcriptional activator